MSNISLEKNSSQLQTQDTQSGVLYSQTLASLGKGLSEEVGFVVDKSQKILSALYMITDLFPAQDYLRSAIRLSTGEAMDLAFDLSLGLKKESFGKIVELDHAWFKTISLLDTANRSKSVSDMNYRLLFNEIESLRKKVRYIFDNKDQLLPLQDLGKNVESSNTFDLDSKFFNVNEGQQVKSGNVSHKVDKDSLASSAKETKNDTASVTTKIVVKTDAKIDEEKIPSGYFQDENKMQTSTSSEGAKSKVLSLEKKEKATGTDNANKTSKNDLKKTVRVDAIKDILKTSPDSSIADIAGGINGCSSKTIQRDLNSMIESGLVMKKGDRRWSTYSLKENAL